MGTPDERLSHSATPAPIDSKPAGSRHDSPSQDRTSPDRKRGRKSIDIAKAQDELSPLIVPTDEDVESPPSLYDTNSQQSSDGWDGGGVEETKSSWYLLLLTLAIGG